jgi:hypothetical protein
MSIQEIQEIQEIQKNQVKISTLATPATLKYYKDCYKEIVSKLLRNEEYILQYDDKLSQCTSFVDQVKKDFEDFNITKLEDTICTQPGHSFKIETGVIIKLKNNYFVRPRYF